MAGIVLGTRATQEHLSKWSPRFFENSPFINKIPSHVLQWLTTFHELAFLPPRVRKILQSSQAPLFYEMKYIKKNCYTIFKIKVNHGTERICLGNHLLRLHRTLRSQKAPGLKGSGTEQESKAQTRTYMLRQHRGHFIVLSKTFAISTKYAMVPNTPGPTISSQLFESVSSARRWTLQVGTGLWKPCVGIVVTI